MENDGMTYLESIPDGLERALTLICAHAPSYVVSGETHDCLRSIACTLICTITRNEEEGRRILHDAFARGDIYVAKLMGLERTGEENDGPKNS